MTKIEEFEQKLIRSGVSEADLLEYEKLLRRVRDNYNRLQHCYLTALAFPQARYAQAAELIRWGLKRYPDSWFSTYTANWDMGLIYERCGQYESAYEAYQQAFQALDEKEKGYRQRVSGDLMWMRLHVDGFRYSPAMEEHYTLFREVDEFLKSFVNVEFRLAVAELVIALHQGQADQAEAAYQHALRVCRPDFVSRVQDVLDRHRAKDLLKLTPECAAFLKAEKEQVGVVTFPRSDILYSQARQP